VLRKRLFWFFLIVFTFEGKCLRGKQGTVSGYRVSKAIRMSRTLASIACAPATSESGEV
jgi:hypothetical protein